jgi:hypothetical protein
MIILIAAALAAATPAAQGGQMQAMDHARIDTMTMPDTAPALREPGQGAFAAIAEATQTLEADRHTDWSRVDIAALRNHLVDMENVTIRANVTMRAVPNGARFDVTSADTAVRKSIQRMLHLHGGMVNQEGGFKASIRDIPTGVSMIVAGATSADAAKIRALGFFGLLTEGMHHQQHHMMLAKGEPMQH